jgi:hypothetical protein
VVQDVDDEDQVERFRVGGEGWAEVMERNLARAGSPV